MKRHVVIVGGGIIGLSSAWYLQRAGWRVTVVDREKIGKACSFGNCGLVCPSHVLPLTEPGAIREAAKAILSPSSAFRIKPRLDPSLWSWLWNFARRCNHESMIHSAYAIQALLHSAMREYQRWTGDERLECEWQKRGLLFVYHDEKKLKHYQETNRILTEVFDEPAQLLDRESTLALEPALKSTVAGSWLYPRDAHLRPDRLIDSLRQRLCELQVEFIENCDAQRITSESGNAKAALRLETGNGPIAADEFVIACGAWTPLLKELAGCKVPIQPGKGYSITMPRPKRCPQLPLIFPECHVAVTPMETGYRLGSIMEFAGYDESISDARLDLLRAGAREFLQEPEAEPVLQTWYGWRPMTSDSVPVIDRSPRWKNVWLATGHNMLGLSMAPATGRLVQELIDHEPTHVDPTPYRLERLGRF